LNIEFTDEGVEADLAFGGHVERCRFPYRAIYVVIDRTTNRGLSIDANMPASVRVERQAARRPSTEASDRAAGKRVRGSSRRRRRKRDQPEPPAPLGVAPEPEEATQTPPPSTDTNADPESTADAEARRRRSGFSVIDGDG
jgi:stringent starvation protein B